MGKPEIKRERLGMLKLCCAIIGIEPTNENIEMIKNKAEEAFMKRKIVNKKKGT